MAKKIRRISEELVGQNATIETKVYRDDYINQLNDAYPIDDVFGERKQMIAAGSEKDIVHFVDDNIYYDGQSIAVIRNIIRASAKADCWQPYTITPDVIKSLKSGNAQKLLEAVKDEGYHVQGMAAFVRKGYGLPTVHNDNLLIIPSQKTIEYFAMQNG